MKRDPKRYHLCVGINTYPGNELAGCVNDALDWADALQNRGSEGIVLTDGQATSERIRETLIGILDRAQSGDRVVWTYSGHGTWVPDKDGDEADQKDECIVPVDYRQAGFITDDLIYRILSNHRRRGVQLLSVFDSCYSGSATRFADFGPAHSHDRRVPRFMHPSALLSGAELDRALAVEDKAASGKPRSAGVLLSGCAPDEVSYDAWFGARPNGAFSRAALDTLPAGPVRFSTWHRLTTRKIAERFPEQHPEIYTTAYQDWKWRL